MDLTFPDVREACLVPVNGPFIFSISPVVWGHDIILQIFFEQRCTHEPNRTAAQWFLKPEEEWHLLQTKLWRVLSGPLLAMSLPREGGAHQSQIHLPSTCTLPSTHALGTWNAVIPPLKPSAFPLGQQGMSPRTGSTAVVDGS